MLKIPALLLLTLVSIRSFAQDELDNIPFKGDKVNDFVPAHWMIEEQIEGDLNIDSKPDKILQLIEKGSQDFTARVLVILLAEQDHYKKVGLNKKLLDCHECRGIGGNADSMKIKRNILIVSVGRGSSDDWGRTTFKFRYDPKVDRLILIGADSEVRIRQEYYKGSTNYLTHVSISKQYYLEGDTLKLDSTDKEEIPKAWIFFEDVKYYEDE